MADTQSDDTDYTDSSVEEGGRYAYRVTAMNDAGESEPSGEAHVDVPARPNSDPPTEPPNPPQTVRIVGDTSTSLTVSWEAPDGGAAVAEYIVQWAGVGENFGRARRDGREAVVDASARSHTITGLTKWDFYMVRVLAVNAAGESEDSGRAWGFPGLGTGNYGHD